MGRPKNDRVWKHYRIIDSKSVQCNYCDKKYKSNVNRMSKHLTKCFKCPEIIRTEIKQTKLCSTRMPLQTNSENMPPVDNQSCNRSKEAPSKNSNDSNMSNETLNMPSTSFSSGVDQSTLVEKLARAIIVSGAPLSLVEHPLWIEFFGDLQPSFNLPSRKTLTTKYLNKIYNEMKKDVKEELDTVLTICIFSWMDGVI